jgi:GAF domain-containing protein
MGPCYHGHRNEYGTMSSSFLPSDPSVLDHPGIISWLSALATVSQALAVAPDEAALAATLSRALTPALGDLCVLYTFESGGALRAIVAPDLSPVTALGRLHAHEGQSAQATAVLARIAHGGSMLVVQEDAGPSWLETLTEDAQHRALLRAAGCRSVVLAPLVARGTALGLLLLASTGDTREYSGADISLIGLLGGALASTLAVWASERREAALNGRLDDLILAARELAHLVNNDLTLPVGALEILLDRPEHPPEIREMLTAAASDLTAAEQHIRGFHQLARGETPGLPGQGHPSPPAAGSGHV